MKYKIEKLEDITYSREIINSTPRGFSKYMVYIIVFLLTIVIIWSVLSQKDIVVIANGVIKCSDETYNISNNISGKITSINLKEGMKINKGDILATIDSTDYEIQERFIEEQLDKKERELECNKKLVISINTEENCLSKDDEIESIFYNKYELYKKIISQYNNEKNLSELKLNNIKTKIDELNLLLKSLEEENNYFTKGNYMYYKYKEYDITLNQYRKQIEIYNEKRKNLEGNRGEKENNLIKEQIKEIEVTISNINTEIEKYKNEQKSYIASCIDEAEESYNQDTIITNTYKEQYLVDITSNISYLEDSINEIKMNLELISLKINNTIIKAEQDGVINVINEIKVGDYIQNGLQIASIIPSDNLDFQAEIYIENKDIGEIVEGKKVILEFISLPQSEYEAVNTKLERISLDSKFNEKENKSYYIGTCKLDKTSIRNKNNKNINIKNGMLVKARIIDRKVSYARYLLEKIHILS